MDITNKTKAPLSLPLPGGKKLFLGPGKTGQINDKALNHPPLVKLIESGDVATSGGSGKHTPSGNSSSGPSSTASRHGGSGAMRQSGDR